MEQSLGASLTGIASPLFSRELLAHCWDEALPLIYANQRETGAFDSDQFHPNPEFYFTQEERGIVRFFTMRHGDKLTGYQAFFCSAHPRYPGVNCALQDVMHASAKNLRFAELLKYCGYVLQEQAFLKP